MLGLIILLVILFDAFRNHANYHSERHDRNNNYYSSLDDSESDEYGDYNSIF